MEGLRSKSAILLFLAIISGKTYSMCFIWSLPKMSATVGSMPLMGVRACCDLQTGVEVRLDPLPSCMSGLFRKAEGENGRPLIGDLWGVTGGLPPMKDILGGLSRLVVWLIRLVLLTW